MVQSKKDLRLLSGNEALAYGAYEAGLSFASAYPGTPSSEILETISRFSKIKSQWAVNEKVAFEVAFSAAIAGVRSLYASKHVGLNVAADPFLTSAYVGVNAGFVVVSCGDPGMHSSQNEQDNRYYSLMAKVPLIEPSSPQEAKEFIKHAFDISERFDIPVLFNMTTRISHTKGVVSLGRRSEVKKREFKIDPKKYVMVPKNARLRHLDLVKRLEKLKVFSNKTDLNSIEWGSKSLGFITSGVSYLYAKESYPHASFLKLGLSYPLPDEKIRTFKSKVKNIFVIEELEPFLESQIKALGIKVKGKDKSFSVSELKPEYIPLIVKGKKKREQENITRKPVMCPGCPHRSVFVALKRVKAVVTGDIGCYTLGAAPPLSSLHSCLCMGAGVTFHEGFKHALGNQAPVVGVVGDSTFVHSGITGLINAVYNKVKGLIIILDNRTTAMTGLQDHPGTGKSITGEKTAQLDLAKISISCGADNVDIVDPYDLDKMTKTISKRINQNALSVIIARRECMLISSNRAKAPKYIEKKCSRCGLCLNIDCPAIIKRDDGFIDIDRAICVGCNLCVSVCSFKALVKDET